MCLATIYKTVKDSEELVLKNASRIDIDGNNVIIRDIMGSETVVEGKLNMIDLANSIVKIEVPA